MEKKVKCAACYFEYSIREIPTSGTSTARRMDEVTFCNKIGIERNIEI